MPKEVTHWLIASRISDALSRSSIGDLLSSNPFCLKLGAVFPDALFYNLNGKDTARFLTLADEFHGSGGEDTYRIIRDLCRATRTTDDKGAMISLMIGILSHIQADALFHPLIYYFSGNIDGQESKAKTMAVRSHRRFESLMDIYFCGGFSQLKTYSLKTYLQNAEIPPEALFKKTLSNINIDKNLPNLDEVMIRAFNVFSFMQGISHNRYLSWSLYAFERILPYKWGEIIALFYGPQLRKHISILSKTLTYRNPVTGKKSTQRLSDIFEIVVKKTTMITLKIAPFILGETSDLNLGIGPSLSFGLEKASKEDGKYFAERPLI